MNKLQTTTHIAVLIASIMFIFNMGLRNLSNATYECDFSKDMATTNIRAAYSLNDPDNRSAERANAYANYYNAFCK
tara:strand:+ start:252 stop:479 length:228 start_codon:yes stop_codon:yes gene_type:complete